MTELLKDQTSPEDPRLDRIASFDDESRQYGVGDLLRALPGQATVPRNYSWRCNVRLDQGQEGSCVGHGIAHELASRPSEVQDITHEFAKQVIYWQAQREDPWPGGEYPGASPRYGGTSVLSGVKVVQRLGYFDAYHWAFGLQDLILGVGYHGPAVLGVKWYTGMFTPDTTGVLHVSGDLAGGHCILCRAVDVEKRRFTLRNSWGIGWGMGGDCFISYEDMDRLLHEQGEAVFFTGRHKVPEPV
jgi:hypothetical protein